MTIPILGDLLRRHLALVDRIAAVAPPPDEWVAVRGRFDAFATAAVPIRDRLIQAIIGGGDNDIAALRALLAGEALGPNQTVFHEVRAAVAAKLGEIHARVAVDSYRKVAAQFDRAATKFSTAAGKCDPEADGADIVGLSDAARSGWLDAAKHAAQLTELAPVLVAAAELASVPVYEDTELLPLVVDTSGLHRRRLWEAWRANGARCGRWSALAALGAQIRAWPAATLDDFEPYRTPAALVRRQFPAPGPDNRGIYQTITVDPEDDPEADIEQLVQQRRAALTH